ncbi:sulfite exporter TauE/SafE family protein [Thioclava sp. GXIMD4216]|uniref:sulfite exporter TauE/SafE family protein n=1 Tax=unclassified Thioclava TaxID=2621713 RepID=UPI0030D421BC
MDQTVLFIIAALIVGMSKGGLASAAAIAVPLLALFMNPVTAAATLLPVYIVTDWIGVWLFRKEFSGRNLLIFTPALLFGVGVATFITPYTPEPVLLLFTGGIGLWFCLRAWCGRGGTKVTQPALLPGLFWGTLTGIASFITHSGSPPAQAYLLPQRLPKLKFAGTIAISFAIGNLAKLPAYFAIGQLDGLNWGLIAALAATGILGTFIGRWLTVKLSDTHYVRVIQGMLFLLSVILLAKGIMTLIGGQALLS